MEKIIKLELNEKYRCEILGVGEIFEIISLENRRKKLRKKYKIGTIYLFSNKDHSGRGVTKEEIEQALKDDGLKLIESGYADAPPWKSNPATEGDKTLMNSIPCLSIFGWVLLTLLVPLFERFYLKRNIAHVTWAFGNYNLRLT